MSDLLHRTKSTPVAGARSSTKTSPTLSRPQTSRQRKSSLRTPRSDVTAPRDTTQKPRPSVLKSLTSREGPPKRACFSDAPTEGVGPSSNVSARRDSQAPDMSRRASRRESRAEPGRRASKAPAWSRKSVFATLDPNVLEYLRSIGQLPAAEEEPQKEEVEGPLSPLLWSPAEERKFRLECLVDRLSKPTFASANKEVMWSNARQKYTDEFKDSSYIYCKDTNKMIEETGGVCRHYPEPNTTLRRRDLRVMNDRISRPTSTSHLRDVRTSDPQPALHLELSHPKTSGKCGRRRRDEDNSKASRSKHPKSAQNDEHTQKEKKGPVNTNGALPIGDAGNHESSESGAVPNGDAGNHKRSESGESKERREGSSKDSKGQRARTPDISRLLIPTKMSDLRSQQSQFVLQTRNKRVPFAPPQYLADANAASLGYVQPSMPIQRRAYLSRNLHYVPHKRRSTAPPTPMERSTPRSVTSDAPLHS